MTKKKIPFSHSEKKFCFNFQNFVFSSKNLKIPFSTCFIKIKAFHFQQVPTLIQQFLLDTNLQLQKFKKVSFSTFLNKIKSVSLSACSNFILAIFIQKRYSNINNKEQNNVQGNIHCFLMSFRFSIDNISLVRSGAKL